MSLRYRFLPKNEDFYAAFIAMATQLRIGGGLLEEMLARDPAIWDKAEEIKEIEHKCDTLTHQIIQRLNTTFVTPIDREDIHALAKSLDDVMDMIDASAKLIRLYKIGAVRYGARELAHVVSVSIDQVRLALEALEKRTGVPERIREIHTLEHEADLIHREGVAQLFREERDAIRVIQWKEILDLLEAATDAGEAVADVLEGIVLKHS